MTQMAAPREDDPAGRTRVPGADVARPVRPDVRAPVRPRFDLPDVDPGSIEVTVDRGVLTITARREEEFGEDERVLVRELTMGGLHSPGLPAGATGRRRDRGRLRQRGPGRPHPGPGDGQAPQGRCPGRRDPEGHPELNRPASPGPGAAVGEPRPAGR